MREPNLERCPADDRGRDLFQYKSDDEENNYPFALFSNLRRACLASVSPLTADKSRLFDRFRRDFFLEMIAAEFVRAKDIIIFSDDERRPLSNELLVVIQVQHRTISSSRGRLSSSAENLRALFLFICVN